MQNDKTRLWSNLTIITIANRSTLNVQFFSKLLLVLNHTKQNIDILSFYEIIRVKSFKDSNRKEVHYSYSGSFFFQTLILSASINQYL